MVRDRVLGRALRRTPYVGIADKERTKGADELKKHRIRVSFNEERALALFQIIARDWEQHTGPFRGVVLPQDRWIPPAVGRELGLWFFYAVLTQRGGIMSEDPFKILLDLWEQQHDLFEPEAVVANWTPDKIERALRDAIIVRMNQAAAAAASKATANGNGHASACDARQLTLFGGEPDDPIDLRVQPALQPVNAPQDQIKGYKLTEHARSWFENSRALATYWESDVRNVFRYGVTEFEEAFRRIDYVRQPLVGFIGMRRKIFSLLVIWMQEKNLIPLFPAPIPVDFHALRVLWDTGVVTFTDERPVPAKPRYPETLIGRRSVGIHERIVDEIAMWSQRFMVQHGLRHDFVNPGLWCLSRELCALHAQNATRKDGQEYLFPEQLEADPRLWPADYWDPCDHCPVEHLCTGVSPSGPYYRWGMLLWLKRIKNPHTRHQLLPDFGEHVQIAQRTIRK